MENPLLLLIPTAIILSIASLYASMLKKTVLESLFLSVTTIVAILFFTGLLNFQGSLMVGYIITVIFAIVSIVFLILKRKKMKNIQLGIGIFIFLIFLLGSIFVNYQRQFVEFDEFTHWGTVLKHMYHFDSLSTYEEINIIFKTYLPGTSLFQYFWLRPFGKFVEYPAYIGFNMMFFSLAFTLLGKLKLKNIAIFTTLLLIPLITGINFYSTLLVDTMLGVLFGSFLLFYYLYRREDMVYTFLLISSISFILTLTKNTGIALVLVSLTLVACNEISIKKGRVKKLLWGKKLNRRSIKRVLLFLSPFLVALIALIFWRGHIYLQDINPIWRSSSGDLSNIRLLQYQRETIKLTMNALLTKPLGPLGLSYLVIVTLLTLFSGLLVVLNSNNVKKYLFSVILIWLGSLINTLSLILFYVFFLPNYEAPNLPSFSRYLFPYVIGMMIFSSFYITLIHKRNGRTKFLLSIVLTALLYIYLLTNVAPFLNTYILKSRDRVNHTIALREKYNDIENKMKYMSEKDTVYIISQGDMGYDALVLRYILSPTNTLFKYDYSVGLTAYHLEPQYRDYPFTKIIGPSDWGNYVLEEYSLVYIYRYDDTLEKIYEHYFESLEEKSLYRVNTNKNGVLELTAID
jgi:hypothetical protein